MHLKRVLRFTVGRGAKKLRQQFILIAGDVINTSLLSGAPAYLCGSKQTEVIAPKPTITAFLLIGCPVESVEADPESSRGGRAAGGP